jgi:hypothetical protein
MKGILWGCVGMVGCCVFYLTWWVLAFKPRGAVSGLKSGWLLLPAVILGVMAVVFTVRAILGAPATPALFPNAAVVWGGIAAYVALLAVTQIFFKRQPTSELLLIVGWTALAFAAVSALYGFGAYTRSAAMAFIAVLVLFLIVSLVCYVLYYRLGKAAGFYDGMVPLVLVLFVNAAMAVGIVVKI